MTQDKRAEVRFFDAFASGNPYDVFTPQSNQRIIEAAMQLGGFQAGYSVADLGCGSGTFTRLLKQRGLNIFGLDISHKLLALGLRSAPAVPYVTGDAEYLPIQSNSMDGVMLMGVIHHFPDPVPFLQEVYRILKPGKKFIAFDPNRANPFMYLYRVKQSPFYSAVGVTENEQPIDAQQVAQYCREIGFHTQTGFMSGLQYRYVESPVARLGLPIYNMLESVLFKAKPLEPLSAFVLTSGVKPPA